MPLHTSVGLVVVVVNSVLVGCLLVLLVLPLVHFLEVFFQDGANACRQYCKIRTML